MVPGLCVIFCTCIYYIIYIYMNRYICMYVCVCLYAYIYIYIYMYTHLCVCISTYGHLHIYRYCLRPPCGQICDATLPAQPILDPASHALERPNSGEEGKEGHPTPSLKGRTHTIIPLKHGYLTDNTTMPSKLQLVGMDNCSKVETNIQKETDMHSRRSKKRSQEEGNNIIKCTLTQRTGHASLAIHHHDPNDKLVNTG